MRPPLFIYGTLLDRRIRFRLLRRWALHLGPKARLSNYACVYVFGKAYPSVKKNSGASTDGRLIYNLPTSIISILNDYESPEFLEEKIKVNVSGRMLSARCYIAKDNVRLSKTRWRHNSRLWQRNVEKYIRCYFSPSLS